MTNPLLGARGAAATYGPQKGATPADVPVLDRAPRRLRRRPRGERPGVRERDSPGAGAAGGVGFGLLCLADRFAALRLEPGIDLVMAEAGFDAKLASADLVLTGEGRIDEQTAYGKTALGVARRAQAAGRPCIAVGGGVTPGGIEALADGRCGRGPGERADRSRWRTRWPPASRPVERCGERLARLVTLGTRGLSDASYDVADMPTAKPTTLRRRRRRRRPGSARGSPPTP